MDAVRAGLRSVVEQAAADLAELRGEVAGLQRELLERFHGRRLFQRVSRIRVSGRDVLAVNLHSEHKGWKTIDLNIHRTGSGGGVPHHTRHDHGESQRIAQLQGKVGERVNALRTQVHALFGALGLEHGCVGGDGDGVRGRANLQDDIDARSLDNLNPDALLNVLSESSRCDSQFIRSRGESGERVVAGRRGDGFIFLPGCQVPSDNSGAGNHGVGRVRNRAGDGPTVALSEA